MTRKSSKVVFAIALSVILTATLAAPASAATKTGSKGCSTGQHPTTYAQVSVLGGTGSYSQKHTWTAINSSGWKNVDKLTYHRTIGIKSGNYTVIGEPSFVAFSVGCASDPI